MIDIDFDQQVHLQVTDENEQVLKVFRRLLLVYVF